MDASRTSTGVSTVTVAARGALCSSASSPKAMPWVAFITEPTPATEMSAWPEYMM